MKGDNSAYTRGSSVFSAILVCFLVCSLCMHAVELKHQHPGQIAGQSHSQTNPFGELSEYMHGTNKKHFIVELTVFLFGGAFIGLQGSTWLEIVTAACVTALCSFRKKRSLMLRYFNLYQHLFSSGLLNPRSHFSLL